MNAKQKKIKQVFNLKWLKSQVTDNLEIKALITFLDESYCNLRNISGLRDIREALQDLDPMPLGMLIILNNSYTAFHNRKIFNKKASNLTKVKAKGGASKSSRIKKKSSHKRNKVANF